MQYESHIRNHFENLSNDVLNFIMFLEYNNQIKFELTKEQWDKLNKFGRENLTVIETFISDDLSSTVKRFGLILFRVSMIITTLRYYDNAEAATTFICSDEDFDVALKIVNVYLEHSIFMFDELPKNTKVTEKIIKRFFDALPTEFQRKEAISRANNLHIKERTADLYLSKLITNKWLDKCKLGVYVKSKN